MSKALKNKRVFQCKIFDLIVMHQKKDQIENIWSACYIYFIGFHINHQVEASSPQIMSWLTESDAGLVSIHPAVVCACEKKIAHKNVIQHKKVGNKPQKDICMKQSKQRKKLNKDLKQTAQGELSMSKKSWKQKVRKFAIYLFANVTLVTALNAGMSVAP